MRVRKVLVLSHWSISDPLTTATLFPTMRVLKDLGVKEQVLLTIERDPLPDIPAKLSWVTEHLPWRASALRPKPLARAVDMLGVAFSAARKVRAMPADLMVARGSIAGGYAHLVSKLTGVPYVVESYEPHASYMVDCGEWEPGSLLHRSAALLERAQKRHAAFLLPVSHGYGRVLIAEGVPEERVLVVPCPVDLVAMRYDPVARERVRARLGVKQGDLLGIYLGKFGGLYLDTEAFRLFAHVHRRFGERFHMLVLTPTDRAKVLARCTEAGIPADHCHVAKVPHEEVPEYLSASDLAFATYRQTPSSAFLSPVKVGEYWANGLPVLLVRGVGDESGIIEAHPEAGALIRPDGMDLEAALDRLASVLVPGRNPSVSGLAVSTRSLSRTQLAYERIMQGLSAAHD